MAVSSESGLLSPPHFLPRDAAMLARLGSRNSVCLSVRPSVCHTRAL